MKKADGGKEEGCRKGEGEEREEKKKEGEEEGNIGKRAGS